MDPLLALIEGVPSEDERRRAIANQLRRNRDYGTMFTMTGDEALTKAGTRLMDDAPEMAHRLGSGRRTDEYNRMMADKYASDMEMNERKQGALERWRQAQEEIKREELKQKGSKTSFTRIPKGDREAFTGYGDTIAGLEQTIAALEDENFDPGQQDLPMENTFKNWLTGTLGEGYAGDKDQDARHQWWQVYDRVYTLPVRNEMFGATLTQGEKDAWNAAHISREMTKQQIKERLEKQLETMKAARDREFKGIVTEGFYNPEAAAGYMGIPDYSAEEPVQERQSIQPLDQGQAPATQPQQPTSRMDDESDDLVVGEIYDDGEGNKYRYLGGGRYNKDNFEFVSGEER